MTRVSTISTVTEENVECVRHLMAHHLVRVRVFCPSPSHHLMQRIAMLSPFREECATSRSDSTETVQNAMLHITITMDCYKIWQAFACYTQQGQCVFFLKLGISEYNRPASVLCYCMECKRLQSWTDSSHCADETPPPLQ